MTRTPASVAIAISMAVATGASWWRFALSGGRFAPGPELLTGGPAVVFAVALSVATAAYLIGLRASKGALSRRHLALAFTIHLCAAPALPFSSTDALMNLAYGRLAILGLNPYRTPPRLLPGSDPYRAQLDWPDNLDRWGPPTVYVAAVAARSDDFRRGLLMFKLAILSAVLISVSVGYLRCTSEPDGEAATAFFFFACNPVLAWELSGQAHNDAILVLCAVGFLWAAGRDRWLPAFLLLSLGTAAKYGLAPTLGLYGLMLWRESRRKLICAALPGLVLIGALWCPFIDGASLRGLAIEVTPSADRVVNSPASIVKFISEAVHAPLFAVWIATTLVLMVVVGLRSARRATSFASVLQESLSFTFLYQLLAMPRFWPWYTTWLLPLGMHRCNSGYRTAVAVFTALAPALYLTGVAGGLAILIVHGVALALWLMARRARDQR